MAAYTQTDCKTLLDEISAFGDVRDSGCILRIEGERYIFETARNVIANRHSLLIAETTEDRLEAHWAGYLEAHGRNTTC